MGQEQLKKPSRHEKKKRNKITFPPIQNISRTAPTRRPFLEGSKNMLAQQSFHRAKQSGLAWHKLSVQSPGNLTLAKPFSKTILT